MVIIWIMFFASVVLVAACLWRFWRRARGLAIVVAERTIPWQIDAAFMFFGVVGAVSCIPGLFFGQPTWAIDHVWWLIAKVAGNAA
jgi:hypothetical protein